ncbi:MAG TPA: helix-turn-helix transcriptional regulator [Acidobacteriaceae bacterium]|nr:helix-turn-helix transcriptional regulator [Acidobacteriaceae bacterium]
MKVTGGTRPVPLALRAMRRRMNVNQTEFAALLGLKQSIVSLYESGRAKPSMQQLMRVLGLTESKLESDLIRQALKDEYGIHTTEKEAARQTAAIAPKPAKSARSRHKNIEFGASYEQTLASVKRAGRVLFTLAHMHGEYLAVASGLYRSVCICGTIPHDEFTAELERLAAGGYVQIVRTSEALVKMGAAGYGVSNWIPHSAQPEAILFVKIQPLGLQLIEGTVFPEGNPGAEAL